MIETLRQHRAEILVIARQYHADNIRLFGSVARGDERLDSDIDLLVDFQPGSTLFDQSGLIDALSNKLGRKVDVVSSRALNRHLAQRIQQEAVTL
ncbi:MAG: nucleotidyltransferase family protein [Geobacter sp.]|nr:nucleotidyltransferase family protein [Geobacter sp.]